MSTGRSNPSGRSRPSRTIKPSLIGLLAVGFVAAACGSTKSNVSTTTSATTVAAATTRAATTAASTVASTTKAPATTVAAATTTIAATTTPPKTTVSPTTSAAGPANSTGGTVDPSIPAWQANATSFRGKNGTKVSYTCPPGGPTGSVWGTETYTDDSSVCSAAVHVGLITVAAGGKVEIQIAPGLDTYQGTTSNGVDTSSYGAWTGSFIFPAAPPGTGHFTVGPESWGVNATDFRGQNGKRVTKQCSPNGTPGSVWGTGTYTDDSSICTAGALEGLITVAKGGQVVIQIAPGAQSYTGSTANGVTSQDYPAFSGSFTFPKDQTSH